MSALVCNRRTALRLPWLQTLRLCGGTARAVSYRRSARTFPRTRASHDRAPPRPPLPRRPARRRAARSTRRAPARRLSRGTAGACGGAGQLAPHPPLPGRHGRRAAPPAGGGAGEGAAGTALPDGARRGGRLSAPPPRGSAVGGGFRKAPPTSSILRRWRRRRPAKPASPPKRSRSHRTSPSAASTRPATWNPPLPRRTPSARGWRWTAWPSFAATSGAARRATRRSSASPSSSLPGNYKVIPKVKGTPPAKPSLSLAKCVPKSTNPSIPSTRKRTPAEAVIPGPV